MKIDILNISGEKVSSYELPKEIFGIKANMGLIHQALVMQLANRRQGTAKTKTRGEVSGGGKKPWKQKGTGRARTGSNRNPVWRGGGIIFGPTGEQNYKKDMPKKQRRKALFSMLSKKAEENNIFGLEEFTLKVPKSKVMVEILHKLPVRRNVLLVLAEENALIERSCSNIPYVKVIQSGYLNVYDLLKYETVIFLKSALDKTEAIWLKYAKEIWKDKDIAEVKGLPKKKVVEKVEKKAEIVKEEKAEVKEVVKAEAKEAVKKVVKTVKKEVVKKAPEKVTAKTKEVVKKPAVKKTITKKTKE